MDLHSTMLLLYRHARAGMRWRIYIYIPLCFYFIAYRDNCPDAYVQFTFHYASTLSYARTPEFADLFNLHSTMLLLYLISLMLFTRPFFIYIPLCFYFIETLEVENIHPEIFTFHYASTLSISPGLL